MGISFHSSYHLSRTTSKDAELQQLVGVTLQVSRKTLRGGKQRIFYRDRTYVPKALWKHVVDWYHTYLMHPRETRTEETAVQHLKWPNIRKLVQEQVKSCDKCKLAKRKRVKYCLLPLKNVDTQIQPWRRLCVDCTGPYKIRRKYKPPIAF